MQNTQNLHVNQDHPGLEVVPDPISGIKTQLVEDLGALCDVCHLQKLRDVCQSPRLPFAF